MPDSAVNLGLLIEEGADRLRRSGAEDGRREAGRIWSDVANASMAQLTLARGQTVDGVLAGKFERAISRRCLGEPLAHVTGISGFRHLTLVSDNRALIPRPETEGLVDLLLQRVESGRVIDVGTGTGCIALSLAQEGHFEQVLGIDRSARALELARENVARTSLDVTLVLADLCEALGNGTVDALVSNPPYLTEAEYGVLDRSVLDWEPQEALVGGAEGMDAIMRLLDDGRRVLRPGGWLALEVDCSRAAIAARQASALGWNDVTVYMDLFGRERYLLAKRSNTR
jgi:release factor glutamine methyltransferase